MERGHHGLEQASRPDTGLLYSVADVARTARVSRVTVVRLCLNGDLPPWQEIDGRRYWDRQGAAEVVARILSGGRTQHAA